MITLAKFQQQLRISMRVGPERIQIFQRTFYHLAAHIQSAGQETNAVLEFENDGLGELAQIEKPALGPETLSLSDDRRSGDQGYSDRSRRDRQAMAEDEFTRDIQSACRPRLHRPSAQKTIDIGAQFRGGTVTLLRFRAHGFEGNGVELACQFRAKTAGPGGLPPASLLQYLRQGLAFQSVRPLPGQKFVQDQTQ